MRCEYSFTIYHIFPNIALESHVQKEKKWHTFLGFGPASLSHKEQKQLHSHWVLDLNPIVILRRTTLEKVDHEFRKKIITLAKFVTKFQLHLIPILLLLSTWKDKKALTSLFNCCSNSSQTLSRILLYFSNSSAMVNNTLYCPAKKLKWKWCHLLINSKWPLGKISWEWSLAAFPLADIFLLFYSMTGTKVTPKKDETGRERWVLHSREARRALAEKGWRPPSPVHHLPPARKPSPMREEEKRQMEEVEKQVEEARRLEDVRRSPSSLLTQQLA